MHRQAYYDHLQAVRESGDWEGWLQFFLEGVLETATQAVETIQKVVRQFENDQQKIETHPQNIRASLIVFHSLKKYPVTDLRKIVELCKISKPTASKAIKNLEELNILEEISGKERGRLYCYTQYLDILNEGINIDNG